ncbi:hypothetical protein [Algoriphagus formosus]|jgi:hypothetical protein|uniref:Uncharacterized protein n=1 Tax=Algoriphagus formosus TaxID=2007308 RepID=A0A4V3AQN4_9BACT|nr:hypothetical protein [Algoriphagus aquimaris]TDK43337.1 hypothetical protein E1898_12050 [Algoriphagus aquimaris]
MIKKRCVIYAKDIQRITGKSERYSHEVLKKIRRLFSKEKGQYVTISEFAVFSGIPEEELLEYIN